MAVKLFFNLIFIFAGPVLNRSEGAGLCAVSAWVSVCLSVCLITSRTVRKNQCLNQCVFEESAELHLDRVEERITFSPSTVSLMHVDMKP